MQYIIENETLEIKHQPGNGAWTYHLIIPNTKNIKGKWGDLKVSGTIDDYEIKHKNVAPLKDSDKILALNSDIRNFIGKSGGDMVNVTLYLENQNTPDKNTQIIVDCFKEALVFDTFKKLNTKEQEEIISDINAAATENQKVEKIVKIIAKLEQSSE